jgi:hypothetical protein
MENGFQDGRQQRWILFFRFMALIMAVNMMRIRKLSRWMEGRSLAITQGKKKYGCYDGAGFLRVQGNE